MARRAAAIAATQQVCACWATYVFRVKINLDCNTAAANKGTVTELPSFLVQALFVAMISRYRTIEVTWNVTSISECESSQ